MMECPYCGYIFPPPKPKIQKQASVDPILSTETHHREWCDVTDISFRHHKGKDGKPDTLRVTYTCGMIDYNAYWCFNHLGYPREKAVNNWARHGGTMPPPTDVADALLKAPHELRMPKAISVKLVGKWPEIVEIRH